MPAHCTPFLNFKSCSLQIQIIEACPKHTIVQLKFISVLTVVNITFIFKKERKYVCLIGS